MTATQISSLLRSLANPEIATSSKRFFKTGKGKYAEGDKFLGIRVPILRGLVKKFQTADLLEIEKLLRSRFHEERLFSLFLLVEKFNKQDIEAKKGIYVLYLNNTRYINNWDLVDSSAYKIVGPYLQTKDRTPLEWLANSACLWERRIAIIATLHFIKQGDYSDTLRISSILVQDDEDLIHKAVGWMLREVGNRDIDTEKLFLANHYQDMPRTMLRYAIEKFPKPKRDLYLSGQI